MARGLTGIAVIALVFVAYEAGQRHAVTQHTGSSVPAPSVSRYVVTPVWPGGEPASEKSEAGPRPQTQEKGMRLEGPGISRDRQIRV
jgi:hypothetical protein